MNFAINLIDDISEKLYLIGYYWLVLHQKMTLGIEYDNHLSFNRTILELKFKKWHDELKV